MAGSCLAHGFPVRLVGGDDLARLEADLAKGRVVAVIDLEPILAVSLPRVDLEPVEPAADFGPEVQVDVPAASLGVFSVGVR